MKKFLLVLGIIFGIGVLVAAIGGIVYASNRDKFEESLVEKTIDEDNEVASLALNLAYGDLQLVDSEDGLLHISYSDGRRSHFEYSYKDGAASLVQIVDKKITFGFMSESNVEITVCIPDSLRDKLTIKMASGKVTSSCKTISVEKADISVASGSIRLNELLVSDRMDIDMASGSVFISDCSANSLKITVASGNLSLDGLKTDSLDFTLRSGEIKLSHIAAESVNGKISSGSATLKLDCSPSDYTVRGNASSGSIRVKQGGNIVEKGKDVHYGSGPKRIDLDLSSGGATVEFGE